MTRIKPWAGPAAQQALAQVKRQGARLNTPCCICRRPIDYTLPSRNPRGCTVQHIRSRLHHPELTWVSTNWAPAHATCNYQWGERDLPDPGAKLAVNATSGW